MPATPTPGHPLQSHRGSDVALSAVLRSLQLLSCLFLLGALLFRHCHPTAPWGFTWSVCILGTCLQPPGLLTGLAATAPGEEVAGTMGTSIPDGKDKGDICKPVYRRRDSAIGPA